MRFPSRNITITAICIAIILIYVIFFNDRSQFVIGDLVYPQGTTYRSSIDGVGYSVYTFTSGYKYDQITIYYRDYFRENHIDIKEGESMYSHFIYVDMSRDNMLKKLWTHKSYTIETITIQIDKSMNETTGVTIYWRKFDGLEAFPEERFNVPPLPQRP